MRYLMAVLLSAACAPARVKLTHLEDRVAVTIDGRPFGSLYFGRESNKPFFHPLTTASGVQYNHVTTAVGFASASDRRVHFGLGKDNTARELQILWPDGAVQTIKNLKADQILTVREP